MRVLLSIKPEYADKIFSGEKYFEFRKAIFSDPEVDTVVVYATMPVGKVIGEFKITQVHTGAPADIWRMTEEGSGISREFFADYFEGRKQAYAIEVGETTVFDTPKTLKEILGRNTAPQSFAYLR
jgi:predicted transcriptional regulator